MIQLATAHKVARCPGLTSFRESVAMRSVSEFLSDDFLLHSNAARELYHGHASSQPIIDYHSHLSPRDIAENRRFSNLAEIWLEGDHYKWRAMRWNGVPEEFCTGSASPWEKFLAFARTVPRTIRNPLYHWTHLELRRYFGIEELLDETTAESIWNRANEQLADLPVQAILAKSNVAAVCTTDDPAEHLDWHEKIAAGSAGTGVFPTFRPDGALLVDQPAAFNAWRKKLASTAGVSGEGFADFLVALSQRHEAFHAVGGRLSDHGLEVCYAADCTEDEAARIYENARGGAAASPEEAGRFRSYLMHFWGGLDAGRGWTKQLHLGAVRNNRPRRFREQGPDLGFDSIGDLPQAHALSRYLGRLDDENRLPKMVLYNLNPAENYVFATMAGNFSEDGIAGKVQFGSGWWFLDQKEGMEWQINALSNVGLLSRFVGMLTDSRSFLSFPRHEYFRRVLCNLLGRDVDRGELPRDMKLLGGIVEDVCFHNARRFFELPITAR